MSRQDYKTAREKLKTDLEALRGKFSSRFAPETNEAKVLLALLVDSEKMFEYDKKMLGGDNVLEGDHVYAGPFSGEAERERNFKSLTALYGYASKVIQCLCQPSVEPDSLNRSLNEFGNEINLLIPSQCTTDRLCAAIKAFSWGLVAFGGLYLMAVAVCPPFALLAGAGALGVGAMFGYGLLGALVTTTGIKAAIHPLDIALDRRYKLAHGFRNTLFNFQKVAPLDNSALQGSPSP